MGGPFYAGFGATLYLPESGGGVSKVKKDGFQGKVLGVRGSISCSSPSYIVYGGNTSCVEVSAGEEHLILDAGTGLRALGYEMLERVGRSSSILCHTHIGTTLVGFRFCSLLPF